MKRFVFLCLSLLTLLILIPGCVTVQPPAVQSPVNNSSSPIDGSTRAPAVITDFSSTLNSDGTSTLLWNVTGADMVSIDQNIGIVSASGTKVISPATATLYTLSATYAKGNSTNDIGTVTKSITVAASVSNTPFVK